MDRNRVHSTFDDEYWYDRSVEKILELLGEAQWPGDCTVTIQLAARLVIDSAKRVSDLSNFELFHSLMNSDPAIAFARYDRPGESGYEVILLFRRSPCRVSRRRTDVPRAIVEPGGLFVDIGPLRNNQYPHIEQEFRVPVSTYLGMHTDTRQMIRNFMNMGYGEPEVPETCKGCKFFHGKSYRNNPMICAVHPEGWNDGECPDKETEVQLPRPEEDGDCSNQFE
jgi:hypothetical protein